VGCHVKTSTSDIKLKWNIEFFYYRVWHPVVCVNVRDMCDVYHYVNIHVPIIYWPVTF
jgi:hypothetical protein